MSDTRVLLQVEETEPNEAIMCRKIRQVVLINCQLIDCHFLFFLPLSKQPIRNNNANVDDD